MTSATSNSKSAPRRGFTLTEILIVIGIIVVLVGILLPTVIRAYSVADKNKTAADIQAIGVALEAYRGDFGDYPRTTPGTTSAGAYVLCAALVGPGPAVDTTVYPVYDNATDYTPGQVISDGSGNNYLAVAVISQSATVHVAQSTVASWLPLPKGLGDGADGMGFRTRASTPPQGKVYGPYLQIDRIKVSGGMLVDANSNPFLYYPAAINKPNITKTPGAVTASPDPVGGFYGGYCGVAPAAGRPYPLYCSTDNLGLMLTTNLCGILGDIGADGKIDPVDTAINSGETAVGNLPYVIIAAGGDGIFGPSTALAKATTMTIWQSNKTLLLSCDDVTNFPR